ncbi:hypothetical protein [Streptomyces syringium]|uniref:hypothetical protein n=1 Tax=Streptomyces syringium TaxID=76729 RepID=UPI003AAC10D3
MSLTPALTPARLLDTPLQQLLDELGVAVVDSPISDANFFGAAFVRKSGRVVLAMPAGRPASIADNIVRALLGQVLGVPLAPLPAPLKVSEI